MPDAGQIMDITAWIGRTKMSGISFGGILAIVFIVLKILKVITWSWLWVLAPLWIGLIIDIVLFVILVIIGVFSDLR